MWLVEVDKDTCTGSESCVTVCRAGVYAMVGGKADAVNMNECNGCLSCIDVCPSGAITVSEL
ncbi:MAG: ferredoxin [Desulfobulbaceae bacterium A2]|nr:MAG: ferredoxin [Desulfobulbaceae bacterium A2]